MDATSTIQDSIHVFNLVHKYVSRILGTYQSYAGVFVFIGRVKLRHMRRDNIIHAATGFILLTVLPEGCYLLFRQKGKSDKCQDDKCQAYNK